MGSVGSNGAMVKGVSAAAAKKAGGKRGALPHVTGPGGLEGAFIQHDYLLGAIKEERTEKKWWRGAWAVTMLALPVVYFLAHEPGKVIGLDAQGKAVRIPELLEAYLTDHRIRSLCGENISDIGTFAFHDYDKRESEQSRLFIDAGWRSISAARLKAGIKASVEANNQTYSTSPNGVCEIVAQGSELGRHFWQLRGTASRRITSNGKPVKEETLKIRIRYVRVGHAENENLVAIEQYEE